MGTREKLVSKKETNKNVEPTNEEIIENQGLQHNSLMEYSKYHLDFIKVFGKKIFVLTIGK